MAKPIFTQQPIARNVLPGATLHIGVIVNDPTATLKVLKDGNVIPGEVLPDYVVGAAQATDAGAYSWAATNPSGSVASNRALVTVGAVVPPVVVVPPTSLVVLGPGSTLVIPDMNNVPWRITADGIITQNGGKIVDGSSGLTRYQGVIYRQDTQNKTWWTIINGIVAQSSTDPTKATPALTWDPAVIVPVPPIDPPVPPIGAVMIPKTANHYPWAVLGMTMLKPGDDMQAALEKGPVCLGRASYGGGKTITWKSGYRLFGMGGQMSDCTGITFDAPGNVANSVLSGIYGGSLNIGGIFEANLIRRNKWCDVNVKPGAMMRNNLVAGFEAGLNVLGGWWYGNHAVGIVKHGTADPSQYAMTIQSPNDGKSDNNVLFWLNETSTPKTMKVSGQKRLTIVGTDIEDLTTTVLDADTTGVIAAFALNGGTDPTRGASGFNVGCDELQLVGGGFGGGGINPMVKSSGLKRLFTAGLLGLTTSGAIGALYNETSSAALLAPILAPVRLGTVWERPNLSPPPDPLGANWNVFPPGYKDATATVQAAIDGNSLLPAGTYYVDGTLTQKSGQVLMGAGDGITIIVATRQQNLFKWIGAGGNGSVNNFHVTDMTIYGGNNAIYANNAGDQLNSCTLSHVTIRKAVNGFCAEKIYGVDNNFFDFVNFVDCGTGIAQKPDPNYSGGETPTMTYIDKTVWFSCQFLNCGMGADMQAKRQNNLDGFLNCIFANCGSPGIFSGDAALTFGQCDFFNSGVLQSQLVYPVGCNFSNTQLTGDVYGEGLIFKGSGPAFVNPGNVILLNTRPGGMTLAGRLLNCNDNAIGQYLFGTAFA